ncbi:MAG: DUF1156 domain-containing protein, partial [Planctomycetes bacterium]|nr:DUF1156 domain-containing protein [Planctomycetota bacterium]
MPRLQQLSMFPMACPVADEPTPHIRAEDLCGRSLMEVQLPARTISREGTAERYSHGKTPHSLHVWWARRPFSSMRALAFASLARVQSIEEARELFELCAALAQFDPYPASAVNAARRVLGQNNVLLDLFGGGGTIAFEAARLGGKAVSIELNPLAVFVQRTLLNYSQKVDNLAELVRGYGFELLKQLWSGTRSLFPNRERDGETIAYFWVRGAACPNADCGATIPAKQLVPLKSRNGASIYAVLEPMHTSKSFRVLLRNSDSLPVDAVVNRILDCPLCGHALQTVKDGQNEMPLALLPVARCAVSPRGKSYIPYKGDELGFDALIDQELSHLGDALPVTELPGWSGIANPTVYGVKKHSDLFSPRQLLVLLRVMGGIRTLYGQISKVHGPDVGKSVVSCLSGLIDQLVDWNSSFTVWLPTNEQVGRSLAGPGLPMQWGFAEIDPFAHGPANLWDKLDRIVQ